MKFSKIAGLLGLVMLSTSASDALAASCGNTAKGFEGFMKAVRKEAAAKGVSQATISLLDNCPV